MNIMPVSTKTGQIITKLMEWRGNTKKKQHALCLIHAFLPEYTEKVNM
jgi:hypothetical protein